MQKIKFDLNRHKKFYKNSTALQKMSQHQSTHKNGIEIFVEKKLFPVDLFHCVVAALFAKKVAVRENSLKRYFLSHSFVSFTTII